MVEVELHAKTFLSSDDGMVLKKKTIIHLHIFIILTYISTKNKNILAYLKFFEFSLLT